MQIAIIFSVILAAAVFPPTITVKPGQCPLPDLSEVGICVNTCETDSDCRRNHKCCRNSCGATTCQAPQELSDVPPPKPSCNTVKCKAGQKCVLQDVRCFRAPCFPLPTCVDVNVKPGQCPKPNPLELGICASNCETDGQCKGSHKCCRNGCGAKTCQAPKDQIPVVIKPTCDTVKCKAGEKCVLTEIRCIRAPCPSGLPVCVPEKPGLCPKPRFSFFSQYCYRPRDRCRDDGQCPGAQKCCRTRCGARCQDPQPTLTCATVDCLPDYTCVEKDRCDKQGCFPRPVCEKVKRCPYYRFWINPDCLPHDECSAQEPNSCPSGTICCATDCGRRCVRPLE